MHHGRGGSLFYLAVLATATAATAIQLHIALESMGSMGGKCRICGGVALCVLL